METAEIKRRWLRFFGDRGHSVVPSALLSTLCAPPIYVLLSRIERATRAITPVEW